MSLASVINIRRSLEYALEKTMVSTDSNESSLGLTCVMCSRVIKVTNMLYFHFSIFLVGLKLTQRAVPAAVLA